MLLKPRFSFGNLEMSNQREHEWRRTSWNVVLEVVQLGYMVFIVFQVTSSTGRTRSCLEAQEVRPTCRFGNSTLGEGYGRGKATISEWTWRLAESAPFFFDSHCSCDTCDKLHEAMLRTVCSVEVWCFVHSPIEHFIVQSKKSFEHFLVISHCLQLLAKRAVWQCGWLSVG